MTLSENITKAQGYLARFKEDGVKNHINGHDVSSSETFETHSPVDMTLLAKVGRGTAADIDAAAKAAKAAFVGWAAMEGEDRRKILHKIADGIVERAEEIAFIVFSSYSKGTSFHEYSTQLLIKSTDNSCCKCQK